MNSTFILGFACLLLIPSFSMASSFTDDFSDGDISDWEARCASGTWSVSGGMVHGTTGSTPAVLAPVSDISFLDCCITAETTGIHAFGVIARLTDEDSGVIAYVSPDNNVARIRLVTNGSLSTILGSISADFPSSVMYLLTFTCEDELLTFSIESPFTGESWEFSATDPNPAPGTIGLLMGQEPLALWDSITATGSVSTEESSSGIVPQPYLSVLANPFTDSVTFRYSLPDGGGSSIDVYDLSGRMVQSIPVNAGAAGEDIVWNSTEPSGVYFARLAGTGLMPVRLIKL